MKIQHHEGGNGGVQLTLTPRRSGMKIPLRNGVDDSRRRIPPRRAPGAGAHMGPVEDAIRNVMIPAIL